MSAIHADVIVRNGQDIIALQAGQITESEVRALALTARVDVGAWFSVVPAHVRDTLDLPEVGRVNFPGNRTEALVGPVMIELGRNVSTTHVIVMGEEMIIGSQTLQDLDVVLDASGTRVVPALRLSGQPRRRFPSFYNIPTQQELDQEMNQAARPGSVPPAVGPAGTSGASGAPVRRASAPLLADPAARPSGIIRLPPTPAAPPISHSVLPVARPRGDGGPKPPQGPEFDS